MVTEVWDHGAAIGVVASDLLVLLRIADAAGEDHRMAWESLGTLSRKTGLSVSTVQRALIRLAERGIVIEVPEDAWPKEARLYRSIVRRVSPVSEWSDVVTMTTSQNDHLVTMTRGKPDDVGLDVVTMTSNYKSLVASNSVEETSSLSPDERDRPRRRRGWDALPERPSRRPSARDKAAAAAAEEDALDPAKAIWGPMEPDPDNPSNTIVRQRRARSIGPAENLARSFEIAGKERYEIDGMAKDKTPGAFNRAALAAQFTAWMRDEMVPRGRIVSMIETYWGAGFQRDLERPAWQDFLAQRGDIFGSQNRKSEADRVERDRHDPAAWE